MRACAVVLLPVALASMASAQGSFSQTDWSGGSGEPGPVTDFGTKYYASSYISWEGIPGSILLRINRVQHMISGDMYGCNYAFPADMDGDGDTDVVASQTLSWERVMWFENDGAGGGWREHEIAWNHSSAWCAYPGDLDNDGDMDVVGANSNPDHPSIEWWRNEDGVGNTWQWFGIDDDFGAPFFVCCADIDGDGRQEVVSTSRTSPDETAWWDKDDFTPPQPPWSKHLIASGSDLGYELFPVDLDQDGDLDVIAAYYSSDGLVFHENTDGSGTSWTDHQINDPWWGARSAHAADVDGDADLDIVACGADGDQVNYLGFFENKGFADSWETHWIYINTWDVFFPLGVHAADLTQDGLVDIACAEGSENWDLTVWQNIDASQNLFAQHILETGPWFQDVNTADFDGDGKLDLLVAASSGGIPIRWYEIDPCGQGRLTSSILDAQGWCDWDSIGWTSVEPEGTDITFQIRGSNHPDEMGAWSDTLTGPCSLEGHLDSAYRFVQYRVHLQAEPGVPSPYLEQVLIHYGSMGVEEGQGGEPLSLSVTPNPFTGLALVSVAGPSAETAVSVYDISGRRIRELSPNAAAAYEWHGLDDSGKAVPSGCYLVRAVRGGEVAQAQIIKL